MNQDSLRGKFQKMIIMYAMLVLLPPEQSALFNHSDRLLVKTYQPVWDVQCVLLKDSCSRLSWWNWMFDIECKQKFSTAKKTPNGSLFCERKGLFRILLCEFYQTPLFFQFSLCLIHYTSRKPFGWEICSHSWFRQHLFHTWYLSRAPRAAPV